MTDKFSMRLDPAEFNAKEAYLEMEGDQVFIKLIDYDDCICYLKVKK